MVTNGSANIVSRSNDTSDKACENDYNNPQLTTASGSVSEVGSDEEDTQGPNTDEGIFSDEE